jgi:hypothetical protein
MLGPNGWQGVLVSEPRGSSGRSVWPQPVGIDAAVGFRVPVSEIHFVDARVRVGNNGKGAKISGGKIVVERVRGQVVRGDSDMVTDVVEEFLGKGRRTAGLLGVGVLAEAAVGVCEAFVVVPAELVDRSSIGRNGERWIRGRPVQGVHRGRVVPVHKVEGSAYHELCAMSCVNGGIICMATGLDGVVPVGGAGLIGAVGLQLGHWFFVQGFSLAVALGAMGRCQSVRGTLELVEELEELIVNAPVTVGDNHTGTTISTVKFVVQSLGQLMFVHGLFARDSQGPDGKRAVYRFALGTHHRRANVLRNIVFIGIPI